VGDKDISKMIKILLIEDNPGDAELIRVMLLMTPGFTVQPEVEEDLSSGLERLGNEQFDLVLLDLGLPDSQGMETLIRVGSDAPGIPIVVLTGIADEGLGSELIRRGAQDYLVKGRLDNDLLIRSLRYAMERNRLQLELDRARLQEHEERESVHLRRLSGSSTSPTISHLYGELPLREGFADSFADAVRRYSQLLDLALEKRDFKVEHNVAESLREIAEELGFLRCGPGDVVDVHRTALAEKGKEVNPTRLRRYSEEGRFLLIELLGDLLSFYRRYYIRSSRSRNVNTDKGGKRV
jgi:DNA-binding NarL/FixJ family response regulator